MYEKYDIKEIRILPASLKLEFSLEEKFREYLRHELPKVNEGEYWYREYGIEVDKKSDILVLFWHSKVIIEVACFSIQKQFLISVVLQKMKYINILIYQKVSDKALPRLTLMQRMRF